jgi:hypothetical protein
VGLVKPAIAELERGVRSGIDDARRNVGEEFITALGPGLTCGAITGVRNALELLLDALPDYGPAG